MNWNPTQNPDCPEAGELEGIKTLILDTEVARMVLATIKEPLNNSPKSAIIRRSPPA